MTAGPDPGERRLERPPSDRYRDPEPDAETRRPPDGTVARGIAAGALASAVAVVATVLLGGALAFSAGLLVVWASAGNAIGLATRIGGAPALLPPRRVQAAVALALAGVALGQLGLWWYAGTEGGVLPLVDYLAQTWGVLVPLQAVLAAGFAWLGAR